MRDRFCHPFRLVWSSVFVLGVGCIRRLVQTKDSARLHCDALTAGLKGLAESAMKASISSTVRGTQVSSSIPSAVTAMSSSMRTCAQEQCFNGVVQTGCVRTASSGREELKGANGTGGKKRGFVNGIRGKTGTFIEKSKKKKTAVLPSLWEKVAHEKKNKTVRYNYTKVSFFPKAPQTATNSLPILNLFQA